MDKSPFVGGLQQKFGWLLDELYWINSPFDGELQAYNQEFQL